MTVRAVGLSFVAMIALASCGPASARDLHVDNGSPLATDGGGATPPDRPFRTISAALARAVAGDTVWVAAGTYREFLHFPRSGDGPDRRIHLAAVDGAQVTIKGSDVVTGWTSAGRGIWRRSGWTVNSQQVFADGVPLQQIGATSPFNARTWGGQPILPARGSGLADLVPGSFLYDAASSTLHVRLAGDADPNAHLIEAAVRDVVVNSGPTSHVELRGLAFAHSNTSAAPSQRGIVNIEGDDWVVSGCKFEYGDFAGLSLSGAGHRVRDSVASHNGNIGITINGSDAAHGWEPYPGRPRQDIVLERNETSDNNYRGFFANFQAGGVKAANACNGVRVSKHVARGNAGTAIWFDLGCRDVTIEQATLERNTRGIEYEISEQAVISGNVVTGSAQHGIYVNASSDVVVADNTLDDNGWGIVVHGVPRSEHPRLDRNEVRGNVIGRSRDVDLVMYVGPEATGNASDFNLFYRPDGGVRIAWTTTASFGVTHRDLAAFSAATGQERHSTTGDPRLRSTLKTPGAARLGGARR
jgi:parallel beta-helix repeat protein